MASSTMSRGRPRSRSVTRSPAPRSYRSRSPSDPRRSRSPGYRSPSPRRNGRHGTRDRSLTPSRTPSRSRSGSYSRDRYSRPRSRTRSGSPALRSTKASQTLIITPSFCAQYSYLTSYCVDCRRATDEECQRRPPPRNLWPVRRDPRP